MPPQLLNQPRNYSLPSSLEGPFSLLADSNTDLWRKPPTTNSFSAPIIYYSVPLSSLRRARVSLRSDWRTLYDQGGLCLILRPPPISNGSVDQEASKTTKWIKTGIEFTHDAPHISTVTCDRTADWSLTPLVGDQVTVELEREVKNEAKTTTLWIYTVEAGGTRRPVREVTWVFDGLDGPEQKGHEAWIGAFAAKPSKDTDRPTSLQVDFWDMAIETWDGPLKL